MKPAKEIQAEFDRIALAESEVRGVCADLLPGAQVMRHRFWRYSLVWTKPT